MHESEVREKLRKVEALFARGGTEGERMAAAAAAERIRARLKTEQNGQQAVEMQFSLKNLWSRQLFVALCRRYELKPYRYSRQRTTTIMLRVPESFANEILWPEFQKLNHILTDYLSGITERLIREEVFAETGEAEAVEEPRQLAV